MTGRLRSAATARARRIERRVLARRLSAGDQVECPCCGWTGHRFLPSHKPRTPNRICGGCGSSERYRALFLWLDGPSLPARAEAPLRVLEVAPFHPVGRRLRSDGHRFTSIDLSSTADVRGDLCLAPFRSGAFDVAICFHVLEHIADDRAAAGELVRVVGDEGAALVVVPVDWSRSTTYEDPTADPADFERLYGQHDHVRVYGADVADRLRLADIVVEELSWSSLFSTGQRARHALEGDDDRFWLCHR